MKRNQFLRNKVVVITGASSGIGKATALEFARHGASVVVAARRQDALDDVVAECQELGGEAVAVVADVADEAAVKNIAAKAMRRFGKIDVWINNAGVSAAGSLEEMPPEVFRRIIDVNLFGTVNGARAVLPYFREQNKGVLINISSQLGKMGGRYFGPYSISKFGVRSLGESLRQELIDTDIKVCTVMPATVDTPFFQHAGTYAGRPLKAMQPVYDVQQVADTIIKVVKNPRREVFVGNSGRISNVLHTVMPATYEKLSARKIEKDHFENKQSSDNPGNLFEPVPQGTTTDGGWQRRYRMQKVRNAALLLTTFALPALAWYFANSARKASELYREPRRRAA
jgi:NAD(P)-dependent dehydrogenase (short-subunit alcohol dehydrogenase family)